ncbi:Druantia anti-phage system protein DruA [Accumulibacter sp.]|uniref:Druantia anti-phage system protein DruA n=1 Tax=Accumulibacter sp. TaxID=2053492 RepID=UPI002629B21D|nr:Druantia anti-phage system protein DruA [Accumulibacter sp.]
MPQIDSAWKLAPRDHFIGWDEVQRLRNLQFVNNARFLILPWIQSKGLASKILSVIQRQLPNDWLQRYGYRPVLFETFVETPRHRGTCYKAANGINVGKTIGRSKKCQSHQPILPIKDIWLYPLRNNFRSLLAR